MCAILKRGDISPAVIGGRNILEQSLIQTQANVSKKLQFITISASDCHITHRYV